MEEYIRKFARIVEAGTYTKAAAELHISQPALTIAVQNLERELNASLFIRTGKRLELTSAGRAVYQAAQAQQQLNRQLIDNLQRLNAQKPTVTIGMIDSIADRLCVTDAFEQLESCANVTLVVNNSRHLRKEVEQHRITCALIVDDELEHQGTTASILGKEELVFVCHPALQATFEQGITDGVIADFISYDRPSTTYRHIQHYLTTQQIRAKTRLYSTSPGVMLSMVLAKKGCAVLPEYLCRSLLASNQLAQLLRPLSRPIGVLTLSGTPLVEPVVRFLKDSRALLREPNC